MLYFVLVETTTAVAYRALLFLLMLQQHIQHCTAQATGGTLRETRALRDHISNTEMEAYKQRAMAGNADRELQFGPGRRLIESQKLNNNNNSNRQLQATATPVPANAHWKINGHVVSHFFMYLNSCPLLSLCFELSVCALWMCIAFRIS